MIAYRPATAADQLAITAHIREAGINPMGLKWPNFIVAVDDETGQIVGSGQIKRHGDGSFELASIATSPAYQHRGVAHQILGQLVLRHPDVLYLTCMDYMEALYQEFGFRTIGPEEMPPYFRRMTRLAKAALLLSRDSRKLLVMKREATDQALDKKRAGKAGPSIAPG